MAKSSPSRRIDWHAGVGEVCVPRCRALSSASVNFYAYRTAPSCRIDFPTGRSSAYHAARLLPCAGLFLFNFFPMRPAIGNARRADSELRHRRPRGLFKRLLDAACDIVTLEPGDRWRKESRIRCRRAQPRCCSAAGTPRWDQRRRARRHGRGTAPAASPLLGHGARAHHATYRRRDLPLRGQCARDHGGESLAALARRDRTAEPGGLDDRHCGATREFHSRRCLSSRHLLRRGRATADQQRTTRQPCTCSGEANIAMPCEIAAIKKPVALHFVSELKLLGRMIVRSHFIAFRKTSIGVPSPSRSGGPTALAYESEARRS